ncbi:MAPEG family protein [Luminiphilus sp.]|nr:MAPEG family protein [Luminiphilus sp.]
MESVNPILGAAAVLGLWSVLMFFIYAVRLVSTGAKVGDLPAGFRGPDADSETPDTVKWTRHNYEHLMEQPTLFYAMVIILAVVGDTSAASCYAAWIYTGARILHSVWQMQVNTIPVRFMLFAISTLALLMLCVHAVMFTLQL